MQVLLAKIKHAVVTTCHCLSGEGRWNGKKGAECQSAGRQKMAHEAGGCCTAQKEGKSAPSGNRGSLDSRRRDSAGGRAGSHVSKQKDKELREVKEGGLIAEGKDEDDSFRGRRRTGGPEAKMLSRGPVRRGRKGLNILSGNCCCCNRNGNKREPPESRRTTDTFHP